ncbi:Cof-type HAD-IIB family hydrolase [Heyndrickxia sporothermodurans]|uniref:Cof-type HAD-IIB family hydrolase n=1 Tax=Heyndrickxia sporothermodurans TaxID=46224 RepID=UPI002E1F316F|nr:Cof-type HAD-IIB family hydrolase [Heyndrickxia sporothermodurans]
MTERIQNRDIRLIALDMDGTLLNSKEEISEENKRVIARAKENGIHIVLSTGRNFATVHEFAEDLELNSFLVTVNGGEIWDSSGKLLERNLLQVEQIKMMWDLKNLHNTKFWAITVDKVFRDEFPDENTFADYEWLKFGFDVEDDNARKIIMEELEKNKLQVTNSSPTNLEVNPYGISKAKALEKVCERIGITMENVMAMGDSMNDIAMIKSAGIGIAMGNAQAIVKEAADWITDTNDNDGVAKAIQRWVL